MNILYTNIFVKNTEELLKFQRTRSLQRAPAHTHAAPEYAFLLMRACPCASIDGKNVDIIYIF